MKNPGYWLTAACAAASLCLPAAAQQSAAAPKGSAVLATVQATAKVMKIDQKTRVVTLKADDGEEYTFVADEAVQNLAQVKKGDVVTATYTQAIAYEVKKGGGAAGASATLAGSAAPIGDKPAGAIGAKVTLTVVVAAIDPKVPSVKFKGPDGSTRTVKVQHPEKLQGVKVGDTVDLTYTEAVAIKVETAAKK